VYCCAKFKIAYVSRAAALFLNLDKNKMKADGGGESQIVLFRTILFSCPSGDWLSFSVKEYISIKTRKLNI